jgi:hypothetical protein
MNLFGIRNKHYFEALPLGVGPAQSIVRELGTNGQNRRTHRGENRCGCREVVGESLAQLVRIP